MLTPGSEIITSQQNRNSHDFLREAAKKQFFVDSPLREGEGVRGCPMSTKVKKNTFFNVSFFYYL